MSLSTSILKSVIANAAKDQRPDDYGVAWYRGMIAAAQHDEEIDQALLGQANKVVDAFRARGAAPTATAQQAIEQAREILAAPAVDPTVTKADMIAALAEVVAAVPAAAERAA